MLLFNPLLAVLLLVFGGLPCWAQEPAYLHYGVSDGLPSGVVYCALQDKKGFMWFGTDKGLVRFDGSRFTVFGMKDGLPDNEVVNMFEDSRGRIWLSCFGQHPAYLHNGAIISAAKDSLLAKVQMAGNFNFFEDQQHRIWICSNSNLVYCLNDKTVDVYHAKNAIQKVAEFGGGLYAFGYWFIYKVVEPTLKEISFTTPPPFLALSAEAMNTLKQKVSEGQASERDFDSNTQHASMAQSGNRILGLYGDGLLLLEHENGRFKEISRLLGVQTATAFTDSDGRFWVTNTDEGALCIDHRKDGLSRPKKYLEGKRVSQIYEDREGNMWFSTLHDGAYALPKNAVQTYRVSSKSPLRSNNLTSISKMLDNRIVTGDDKGHVYIKSANKWDVFSFKNYIGYNRIRQILPQLDSTWMAVSDKAIAFENREAIVFSSAYGSYKSACLHNGSVCAGTSTSFLKWKGKDANPEILSNGRTMLVHSDAQNMLWIGKLNGLYSGRDNFNKKWGDVFPPLASRILDIQQAGNNALWLATPDYGLLRVGVNQGAVTRVEIINEKLPRPIENIQSIFAEADGKVWLATNKGVFFIRPDWSVGHYNQTNGLASNDVNAVLVDNDTLWAATVSGLSKLLLKQTGETGDFATRIVGIRYIHGNDNHQYDLATESPSQHQIVLPTDASLLEVELAGLHYRTRGNLQFEYKNQVKLLPFHLLTFGNLFTCLFGEKTETTIIQDADHDFGVRLTPGRFVGTATAILPGGARSTQPDQITITITPHWWQTIWAQLLVVGLLIFAVIRFFKGRAAFLKLQNTASELQLQAIKSQMNPHFVGNSINAIQQFFYPPDPVKASEYIAIFSDLLRRTMTFSEMDFIPFHEELQYVKDYLEMVKLRFGDHFSYDISGVEKIEHGAMFPAMILQPILENATIHGLSPEGVSHLTVHFEATKNRLIATLTDNGVGIQESLHRKNSKPQRRPSKGLDLLNRKVQMLNKLYTIDLKTTTTDLRKLGHANQGTQVVVSFVNINVKN